MTATSEERRQWHARRRANATQLGTRLRRLRLTAGQTMEQLATATGLATATLRQHELGRHVPAPWYIAAYAEALGLPIAAMFTDELVLAEVRVSAETLERVKRDGEPAAAEAGQRIAAALAPLLLAAATREPVDVRPGAGPKRRRTRADVLAGVEAAKRGTRDRLEREAKDRRIE